MQTREVPVPAASARPLFWKKLKKLGPGLVTGAADDDPSGIATYSQAGAGYGYGILWTSFFTYPLMVGIQVVSARIGRVTGHGLAANITRHYPAWLLNTIVSLLFVANTINIAADLGAMGAALKLLVGGPALAYAAGFALLSLGLQIFIPFPRYAPLLKGMTLALLAYAATLFVVEIPWQAVLEGILQPHLSFRPHYVMTVVAVFGTTISPYLFFWQASQEVEEQRARDGAHPLKVAPEQAHRALKRIRFDTWMGMGFSNLIALFIMLTTAVTLHAHGVTDIETSAQAAEALRPVAGEFAFVIFAAGIVGTGMLAVPVLAGSTAYAVAEARGWPCSLGEPFSCARGFYGVLAASVVLAMLLNLVDIDPIRALYWSAVINGVIAVPIMALMMNMAVRREIMGQFVITRRTRVLGWLATTVMAVAVLAMFATWNA